MSNRIGRFDDENYRKKAEIRGFYGLPEDASDEDVMDAEFLRVYGEVAAVIDGKRRIDSNSLSLRHLKLSDNLPQQEQIAAVKARYAASMKRLLGLSETASGQDILNAMEKRREEKFKNESEMN